MTKIDLSTAKAELSKYARLAESGETILVCKRNKPSFVIAPPSPNSAVKKPKQLGLLKGKMRMAEDFDQTPEEVIDAFYK